MLRTENNRHKATIRGRAMPIPPPEGVERRETITLVVEPEFLELSQLTGVKPERLARMVLGAFVQGLDPEQPSIELPLRLVEARRVEAALIPPTAEDPRHR